MSHQNQLGWQNFLFGQISPLWKIYQKSFLLETKLKLTLDTWAHGLITYTWKLLFALWDTRNDTKHNNDTVAQTEAYHQINSQIEHQYQLGISTLSTENASLLNYSFENILTLPYDYKIQLMGLLEAARANFAH